MCVSSCGRGGVWWLVEGRSTILGSPWRRFGLGGVFLGQHLGVVLFAVVEGEAGRTGNWLLSLATWVDMNA